jgi:hypothetical protein
LSTDIQHGIVEFRKSALPATDKKRVRRGLFYSLYWIVPGSVSAEKDPNGPWYRFPAGALTTNLMPWNAEVGYAIKEWGADFRHYAYAHANAPGSHVFDDLAQELRLELLKHEAAGDNVPRFTADGKMNANVVQVCKNRLLDLWAEITVESPAKEKLPFTSQFRKRNWDGHETRDDEGNATIPEYWIHGGVDSLDDPGAGENDGGASYDENAEGASSLQRIIEGPSDDATGVDCIADNVTTQKNANEEKMIDTLTEGGNEALLDRAMLAVSEDERCAVRLWFGLDGDALTRRQIADQIGKQLSAAKKYVQRAVKKIKREWERQQDTEQRSYAYAALPTNWNDECHRTALSVWGDLHITKESYLRQLALREKFRKMALENPTRAWMCVPDFYESYSEPRIIEFADTYKLVRRTVGHFTIPAEEDDATIEKREAREALLDYERPTGDAGITYTLESRWEKEVKLIAGSPTWRECGNSDCPHDVVLVGRRQRIFLGGREKVRGVLVPCPLCVIFDASGLSKQCPLCKTQGNLNTLCEGCFADSLPAEMARRRGDRVQAMPSNNGQPSWFVDIRTNQEPEIGLAHLEDHEDANGRVIIATDPVALPAIVLEDPVDVLVPVGGNGVAHVFGEQREAPAHLAGMTPEEYLERQRLLHGNRIANKESEVA